MTSIGARTARGVIVVAGLILPASVGLGAAFPLALATLGFGILLERMVYRTRIMFEAGAEQVLQAPRPSFAESDKAFYYVVLVVADLDRAVQFYADVLGLPLLRKRKLAGLLNAIEMQIERLLTSNGYDAHVAWLYTPLAKPLSEGTCRLRR